MGSGSGADVGQLSLDNCHRPHHPRLPVGRVGLVVGLDHLPSLQPASVNLLMVPLPAGAPGSPGKVQSLRGEAAVPLEETGCLFDVAHHNLLTNDYCQFPTGNLSTKLLCAQIACKEESLVQANRSLRALRHFVSKSLDYA